MEKTDVLVEPEPTPAADAARPATPAALYRQMCRYGLTWRQHAHAGHVQASGGPLPMADLDGPTAAQRITSAAELTGILAQGWWALTAPPPPPDAAKETT